MIDFDSYTETLPIEKIEDYKYLYNLTKQEGDRVAYHRADADGIISAVIVKTVYSDRNLVMIPLGYEALELNGFGKYLSNLTWLAIVDLPPFAHTTTTLFCDHHQSNEGANFDAQLSIFDPKAPSAAILLANKFPNIPGIIKELAELTEITDTAGYTIPAPLEINESYSTKQERAWALNDVCKTQETSANINKLVEKLSSEGFEAIPRYYNDAISRHRLKRKNSVELAKKLKISDMVILNFSDDTFNRFAILHELLNRGAKVGVVILAEKSIFVLGFRHSKSLSKEEQIKYRLDTLAKEFGGGGHISASGARVTSLEGNIQKIVSWGKSKGLKPVVQEVL